MLTLTIIFGFIAVWGAIGSFATADMINDKIAFGIFSVGLMSEEQHDRRIQEIQRLRVCNFIWNIVFIVFSISFVISLVSLLGGK